MSPSARLQIVSDHQLIAGLRGNLSGHAAVGRVEIAASGASGDRVNDDIAHGDRLLGLG